MKKLLIATLLLALSPLSYAGSSSGLVTNYLVLRHGKLFFIAGAINGTPACNTNRAWAVDLIGPDAAAGKAIFAVILAAHAAGKSVYVWGKGNCDVWGDRETVEYINVID